MSPPLRLSVHLAPPLRLVTVVAESRRGRRSHIATLMAPWRCNPDRSPFLRSGKYGVSYSLNVAEAWGGGGVDGQCLTYLNFTLTSPLPCPCPTLPSVWFSSFSWCEQAKFCSSWLCRYHFKAWSLLARHCQELTLPPWTWCSLLRQSHLCLAPFSGVD